MLDSITYKTVFEPTFPWFFPVLALVILVVGIVKARSANGSKAFGVLLVLLGVPATLGVASITYSNYAYARDAARSPNTPTVEGVVEHFLAGVSSGPQKRPETFTVRGIPFSYASAVITGGFTHEGLVGEGQFVRIRYIPNRFGSNLIVRLEVADKKGVS